MMDNKKLRCAWSAAAFLLATCAASGATAGPVVEASHGPADLSQTVKIKLTGRIADRCVLSGGKTFKFEQISGGEGATAAFDLDCNVPFDINIRSASGGLAHDAMPQGQGPFSGLLAYDLHVAVPTLRPEPDVINGHYTSRELTHTRILSSGDGIGAGGGALTFKMHHPEGAGLLAGNYSETLYLTVTPRM